MEEDKVIQTSEAKGRYRSLLSGIGLNPNEAGVYETLLERGQLSIQKLTSILPEIKRTNLYSILYSLRDKGLIEQTLTGKKINFRLAHPSELENFIEKREEGLSIVKKELSAVLPNLVSNFNLTYHKPGVKVFEGKEGTMKLMEDSLTAKTEIYSFIDPEAIFGHLEEENSWYMRERLKRGIIKKNILNDTPYNRNTVVETLSEVTQNRFIPKKMKILETSLQVYDNKVAFHTLKQNLELGIIIEDPYIAKAQRALFEFVWENASK